ADQASAADLLLECSAPDVLGAVVASGSERPRLRVRTKCDLDGSPPLPDAIATSALTGLGLDDLRRAIAAALRAEDAEADLATTTGARCRESLTKASEALAAASEALV